MKMNTLLVGSRPAVGVEFIGLDVPGSADTPGGMVGFDVLERLGALKIEHYVLLYFMSVVEQHPETVGKFEGWIMATRSMVADAIHHSGYERPCLRTVSRGLSELVRLKWLERHPTQTALYRLCLDVVKGHVKPVVA